MRRRSSAVNDSISCKSVAHSDLAEPIDDVGREPEHLRELEHQECALLDRRGPVRVVLAARQPPEFANRCRQSQNRAGRIRQGEPIEQQAGSQGNPPGSPPGSAAPRGRRGARPDGSSRPSRARARSVAERNRSHSSSPTPSASSDSRIESSGPTSVILESAQLLGKPAHPVGGRPPRMAVK